MRQIESNIIKTSMQFIQQNFQQDIRVAELAAHVNISVSSLERQFKKTLCKTPNQVISEIRLENAKEQLEDTDLPIGRIAVHNGFTDHSYFSLVYKRKFNEKPSETRQKKLKNQ